MLRPALERELAREHLARHERERVDVGPAVERSAAELLGTHELRRAEDDSGRGEPLQLELRRAFLGQTEIHDDSVLAAVRPRAYHDVLRLQIPVHDFESVRDV